MPTFKSMDPNPEYNRGEDANGTTEDIAELAKHALAMADLTSLYTAMQTIAYLCQKTTTHPVD